MGFNDASDERQSQSKESKAIGTVGASLVCLPEAIAFSIDLLSRDPNCCISDPEIVPLDPSLNVYCSPDLSIVQIIVEQVSEQPG